jgi:hypothetical protein
LCSTTTSKKFYATHGTHKDRIFTKWFGKGGAEQATKYRGLTFHGLIDREAAEYCLTMPNVEAARDWAKTQGKSKNWSDFFAPEIGGAATTAAAAATDNFSSSVEPPSTPPSEFKEDPPPPPPPSATSCLQQTS